MNFSWRTLKLLIPTFAKFNIGDVRILNDRADIFPDITNLRILGGLNP